MIDYYWSGRVSWRHSMTDAENEVLESTQSTDLEKSDDVIGREQSFKKKLGSLVQIDDSELPQSIKDEFREK
jgi:hypothetical protein